MSLASETAAPDDDAAGPPPPPRRQFSTGVIALAAVSSLLLGYAAATLILRPEAAPDAGSAEAGFARDMITHHDQAVTMGVIAYRQAETAEVRQLGYDIALTQQGEIGMMHQWLRSWGLSPTGSAPRMAWMQEDLDSELVREGSLMPGLATAEQLAALGEATGTEVDRRFLELMTYHHLGGIHMIDGVLDRSDHPDVTWLAGLMREAQESDLAAMRDLLAGLDRERS